MIWFINILLFFVRMARFDFSLLTAVERKSGEVCNLWDIKPGDVFRRVGEGQWVVAEGIPIILWKKGVWGCMASPEEGEWLDP